MGLNSHQNINYGGGGGNQLNSVAIDYFGSPLPGDFLIYTIMWQCGLPSGGYVPFQPTFQVFDDAGQEWINLFDVFATGPGGAYNSQYSMSVWYCPAARGGPFKITTLSNPVPLIQDNQGHGSLLDWQLDNRNAIQHFSKVDNTNTATPSIDPFNVAVNQLIIASFYDPNRTAINIAITPGYTEINNVGTTTDFMDEYIVRPRTDAQQAPGIIATAPQPIWLMTALVIDISQPALQVGQIRIGDLTQLAIEE